MESSMFLKLLKWLYFYRNVTAFDDVAPVHVFGSYLRIVSPHTCMGQGVEQSLAREVVFIPPAFVRRIQRDADLQLSMERDRRELCPKHKRTNS